MPEESEQPQAIEILPPLKNKPWEPQGGDITIFRLRLMTQEEIERHGLEKYATNLKNSKHR